MPKKVFVSGCFDLLHSGHIAFLKEAAQYGDLYVALGSDKTVFELKGRRPLTTEQERLFMLRSISFVKDAVISRGSGILDFLPELDEIRPDIFVVNEDGNTPAKKKLCQERGIVYKVLKRIPHAGLPERSTTGLRKLNLIPYRIDIAGGWLDQPFVSRYYPGPVITLSIEPTIEFNDRSGMATSTRRAAIDLWGTRLPPGEPEKLAKILFAVDNPPGTKEISGSQDAIGIVCPGLNKSWYDGEYWPTRIDHINDESILKFVESSLYLLPLGPRGPEFGVIYNTHIDTPRAKALSDAAEGCWDAILNQDIRRFGQFVRASFEAQIAMFPDMMTDTVAETIAQVQDWALGWKLSGAGGGGYLIVVSGEPVEGAIQVIARQGD